MSRPHFSKRKKLHFLTEDMKTSIMVLPRMHLECLFQGDLDKGYCHSVIGVFNIALTADSRKGKRYADIFEAGQRITVRLLLEQTPLSEVERAELAASFNVADRFLRVLPMEVLASTINYVESKISAGKALPVHIFYQSQTQTQEGTQIE